MKQIAVTFTITDQFGIPRGMQIIKIPVKEYDFEKLRSELQKRHGYVTILNTTEVEVDANKEN